MKPIVLCILDGVGINNSAEHNAVKLANMPYFDYLLKKYAHSKLKTSGVFVGLPKNVMGNSEVGHITIGSGRVVNQFLRRFQLENFEKNKQLNAFIKSVKKDKGVIHIAGLMSDGRVHSDIHDILTIIKYVLKSGLKICIHFISDGRDTPQNSAKKYINLIKKELKIPLNKGNVFFGSLSGRYYAMDRNHNLDRTKLAYDAISKSKSQYSATNIDDALKIAYQRGETDEFIKPTVINSIPITSKDGFIFGNYRSDRARQIVREVLKTKCHILCFSQYGEGLNTKCIPLLYDEQIKNTLGFMLEKYGKSQLRIAETEKYNHVTYFMDAEKNIDYKHEEKILIPSPNVTTFDKKPEMSARKITKTLLSKLSKFDVVLLNYANGDMVGHTGNEKAAIKAMEVLDEQLSLLIPQILKLDGIAIIIADHGNSEQMWDYKHNVPLTSHTTNPVYCIVVSNHKYHVNNGGLYDIAPTILNLLNIPVPSEMTGKNLIY